jgi:hypothetical protein
MAVNLQNPTQAPGYSILQVIQDVLVGKAENTELEPALVASRAALDETEKNFLAAWDLLDPKVQTLCASLKDSALGFFEQIRIALTWVDETADDANKDTLSTAANTINRSNFQLNLLFVHLRNSAWSLQGPTEIPTLNAFIWANDFYQQDQAQSQALKELISVEKTTVRGALAELDNGVQTREIEALREAFKTHSSDLETFSAAVNADQKEEVARVLDTLRIGFVRLQELVPAAHLSQRTHGPTKSPQINVVVNFTNDYLQDKIQDIVLMNALDVLYRDYLTAFGAYQQLSSRLSDSVLINEEVQLVGKAYALQQQAFDCYTAFFSGRALQQLERGRDTLIEAAQAIERSYQTLHDLAAREGKTLCIRCGEYNPPDRQRCQKCSATLPLAFLGVQNSTFETSENEPAEQPKSAPPVLTGNMVRLYTAVNGMADGSMTEEQFITELEWFEGVLQKSADLRSNQPDLEAVAEADRSFHEEVMQRTEDASPLFDEALAEFHQALEKFRQFAESKEVSLAEDGVRLCDGAARKMVEIRDIPKSLVASSAE